MTAKYDGEWRRVDGEKFYLVVKDNLLFRQVLIRNGAYGYTDDTLLSTTSWKFRKTPLEKQVMETIDKYMSDKRSKERQVDNAVKKMEEVYGDDW